MMHVPVNDEQLFVDRIQYMQYALDLLNTSSLTQISVNHQYAARREDRLLAEDAGDYLVTRLQRGADGRYLPRLIG